MFCLQTENHTNSINFHSPISQNIILMKTITLLVLLLSWMVKNKNKIYIIYQENTKNLNVKFTN